MKKTLTFVVALMAVATIVSSALATESTTTEAIQQVADMLEVEIVGGVSRVEIPTLEGETIAHYSALLKVGPFQYDTIGIHRVVKEEAEGVPAPTTDGILCSGGDMCTFNLVYLPTTLPDPSGSGYTLGQVLYSLTGGEVKALDHSLGIYMAKRGLDVWGIDWRWATIHIDNPLDPLASAPMPTATDPGIMHLNTDSHLDDFEMALKVARGTRGLTGQGNGKMYVTGWSRGAYMTLALANRQAVYSGFARDIKGIIPVDFPFKSNDKFVKQNAAMRVDGYDDILANEGGVYPPFNNPAIIPPVFNILGAAFMEAAYLSLTAPTDDHWLFTDPQGNPLPNAAVYDFMLSQTGTAFTLLAGGNFKWQWHFNLLDAPGSGVHTNYTYMQLASLYVAPFQSYGEQRDSMVCLADGGVEGLPVEDSPYDDNLSEIHIPVLLVGADGGAVGYIDEDGNIAYTVQDTLNRLGGDENEILHVGNGYGHADLYYGTNADVDFWAPMVDWIMYR